MNKNHFLKKWTAKKSLIVILLVQMIAMAFWGNAKKGYFVDELWSYGLANSYYFPHIFSNQALEDRWVDKDFFLDYIEVGEGERFSYESVVYNLSNDAHPPIFFIVLHTVCSLFPGTFSKWYGIIPNMIYFLLAQLLLYRLSRRVFKNEWLAVLLCGVWGFSSAAVSFVLFIRMYMLSTMCGLLTLNLHFDLMQEETLHNKRSVWMWFLVLAISFFGYMCHYYYFIFAFFLSAFYMLYLFVQKNWNRMIWYASAMGGSLLLTAVVFPAAFTNLFGNGYTKSAVNGIGVYQLLSKIYKYILVVITDLFANSVALFLIIIFVASIALVMFIGKTIKNKKYRKKQSVNIWFFWICAGTTICYYILAVQISPSLSNRYISTLYPLIYLLLIWLIHMVWEEKKVFGVRVTMMAAAVLIIASLWSQSRCVDFVYARAESNEEAVEPYIDTDVYFITYNFYKVTEKIPELINAARVSVLAPQDWRIEEALAERDKKRDHLIVYIDSSEGMEEQILGQIVSETEFTKYQPVEGYSLLYGGACLAYLVY